MTSNTIYKRKKNYVADALSRPALDADHSVKLIHANDITNENNEDNGSNITYHSANEDNLQYIPISEASLNTFKNQIIIKEGKENKIIRRKYFGRLRVTYISKNIDEKYLQYTLNNHTAKKGFVAIYIPNLAIYSQFHNKYLKWRSSHSKLKFVKCSYIVFDCTDKGEI